MQIKQALISVSDKTNLLELGRFLQEKQITILATGGTYKHLKSNGIPAQEVAEYTGSPEILGGRVKTLHPKIHGGILARGEQDAQTLTEHDINRIDLVIVNLYPFQSVVAKVETTMEEAVENIDIGGIALLRAAAKNYRYCVVISDAADYAQLKATLSTGDVPCSTRLQYAQKAFSVTNQYDQAISQYLSVQMRQQAEAQMDEVHFETQLTLDYQLKTTLRYGENPHQKAAFYTTSPAQQSPNGTIAQAIQLTGKALSYNNIADADAALSCVNQFETPACVIVKHANPCGAACADDVPDAYVMAFQGDPVSAFGGIIAFNRPVSLSLFKHIMDNQFAEVIIAPEFKDAAAFSKLNTNIRVLETGYKRQEPQMTIKSISGGILMQDADAINLSVDDFIPVTHRQPEQNEWQDCQFAWRMAKSVKSNAIVLAKDNRTVGIGAGQMSRIYSLKTAIDKAQEFGLELKGASMASDAFFPFDDCLQMASQFGITAVVHPGGSMRDAEVIDSANRLQISLLTTGIRHFNH